LNNYLLLQESRNYIARNWSIYLCTHWA